MQPGNAEEGAAGHARDAAGRIELGATNLATLAVRMTGSPSAVDRGSIEEERACGQGLELGKDTCSSGAERGGAAGFGVVGRVESASASASGLVWRYPSASVSAWVTWSCQVLVSVSGVGDGVEMRPRKGRRSTLARVGEPDVTVGPLREEHQTLSVGRKRDVGFEVLNHAGGRDLAMAPTPETFRQNPNPSVKYRFPSDPATIPPLEQSLPAPLTKTHADPAGCVPGECWSSNW